MSYTTRSKFYVSTQNISSSQPFEGQKHYLNATIKLNAAYSPDPSTENHSFWSATPSGQATIHLNGEEKYKQYKAGSFWYIDITEDEEGAWSIKILNRNEYGINVELIDSEGSSYTPNTIALSITNKEVWFMFEEDKKYSVKFIPAVKS